MARVAVPEGMAEQQMEVQEEEEEDRREGSVPNVHWRAVPMEDLRLHPLYQPLPPTDHVTLSSSSSSSSSPEDIAGLFRQGSWQWEALHAGRLTTSRMAAVLGFFEHEAADLLAIPRSLRGHHRAVEGWQQLRRKPLPLQALQGEDEADPEEPPPPPPAPTTTAPSGSCWVVSQPGECFSFSYQPVPHGHYPSGGSPPRLHDVSAVRLAWGSAQEATAILAVLNYFARAGGKVREAGMCLFEALEARDQEAASYGVARRWREEGSLPLLGASPDGLLALGDDDNDNSCLAVVEVKCFSPFQPSSLHHGQMHCSSFRPAGDGGAGGGVPVWHIPQLQLEMFCAGSRCSAAYLLVLFIDGARLYRIPRDDQYQLDMLAWAREFYCKFITQQPSNRMKAPPPNFFSPHGGHKGSSNSYALFLQQTKRLAAAAELVAELDSEEVQRSPFACNFFHP
eukprot:gene8438-9304_t